ncbi:MULTISPECIES: flagellar basal body rod protein FlgB [unclassified Thioalkalivibrio]|uniref:flagellar basal body rod protein FlgB n=1 Tax=unclassified Thioalkalivibrio TaxID=2621013 RepID=UPI000378EFB2|nr:MULTISPECIES: flagellar basal body rod protein FlgB [unclassified Thioalkalivibrio]PYG00807.1 flagellar basal-body rod protein FlgB [Thioalkalivibrio sp. ALE21]
MSISLDKALGILPESVNLRSQRMEVLSSNIANADTPGYKARDLDFRSQLEAADGGGGGQLAMSQTRAGHQDPGTAAAGTGAELKYRIPSQPSLDGNTVDPQMERAAFAENSVKYQSSLEFLNRRVSGIRDAFRGNR